MNNNCCNESKREETQSKSKKASEGCDNFPRYFTKPEQMLEAI